MYTYGPTLSRPDALPISLVFTRSWMMTLTEINFDGVIGPSQNYAGLSPGKLASTLHAGNVAYPRAAALQGLEKMRANIALGLTQGLFLPHDRPDSVWLAKLGTTVEEAEPHVRAADRKSTRLNSSH